MAGKVSATGDGPKPAHSRPKGGGGYGLLPNALIVDHSGIYKADVGLRDGLIAAIGKAGNPPNTQPGVTIVIGPGTEVIAGEGKDPDRRRHGCAYPFHLPAAE